MPPVIFEPTIPGRAGPQLYALDREATGIDQLQVLTAKFQRKEPLYPNGGPISGQHSLVNRIMLSRNVGKGVLFDAV
jgi:hypothetical protein